MDVSISEMLSEQRSLGIFLLLAVAIGGTASLLIGRAVALTWRPWWHVIGFSLLLGAAVRFLHAALFGETLLSVYYYAVDTAVCVAFGLLGFRLTRVAQMVRNYGWINQRAGLFRWRRRPSHDTESG